MKRAAPPSRIRRHLAGRDGAASDVARAQQTPRLPGELGIETGSLWRSYMANGGRLS